MVSLQHDVIDPVKSFLRQLQVWRPCLFCQVASGNSKDQIVYQDDDIVAFLDIRPAAETHLLIIPTRHIQSVKTVQAQDYDLLLRMRSKAMELLKDRGHHDPAHHRLGFHIPPFNTVDHLHLHVLGGSFKSPEHSTKYEMGQRWYLDLSTLLVDLEKKRAMQEQKMSP